MAEAVEKVRTINICATIVPVSRARRNFDSMKYGQLNHCFKDFAFRDFFNSLSHNRTIEAKSRSADVSLSSNRLQSQADYVDL